MHSKILNKLEEMAENPEGILSICVDEDCRKIKVVINSEENWVGRDDFPNPEMYDSIVESYHDLGPKKDFKEGYHMDTVLKGLKLI